jgi:hypothetical protein
MDTQFVELSRVARLLNQSGKYEPLFWFRTPYKALERDLTICHSEDWNYLAPTLPQVTNTQKWDMQRVWNALESRLPATIAFIPRVFRLLKAYRRQVHQMKDLFDEYQPQLIVLADDNIKHLLCVLIQVARARGIPSVIVPFSYASTSTKAEVRFHHAEFMASNSLVSRLIAARYHHWVYAYKGRKLLHLPAENVFALEWLGYAPRQPWAYKCEETSLIAVENEYMFQSYRNENVPEDRLIMTGALYDDVLAANLQDAEARRTALFQELDQPPNQPLLLCALPQNQFPWPCDFRDYEALIRFWMGALTDIPGWNVVAKPHPRLTDREIGSLKDYGVKITKRDTASLIPLCDIYVASVSSTIRWAVACGKPVVNYDVYQTGYRDYEDVQGVITINTKDAFLATLNRMTSESDDLAQITALQRESMPQWGNLDGKSGERMLQLFNDVISAGTRR